MDYFSLDIEGPELKILQTIPFDRIHFSIITIELNSADMRHQVTKYMLEQGFEVQFLISSELRLSVM